jgi:hypothetical protein
VEESCGIVYCHRPDQAAALLIRAGLDEGAAKQPADQDGTRA